MLPNIVYFVRRESFEEALMSYVVHYGRNIKNVKSDKIRAKLHF